MDEPFTCSCQMKTDLENSADVGLAEDKGIDNVDSIIYGNNKSNKKTIKI